MISVVFDRNKYKLTLEGHAYSGEAGHDLVCSAASILAYTLASNIEYIAECGQAKEPMAELKEGSATICCMPQKGYASIVALVFETICAGYSLLANNYPENLTFTVIESI